MQELNLFLIILGFSLVGLTYAGGALIQCLPLPRDIKKIGPQMMRDACFTQLALGTVSALQVLVTVISNAIGTSLIGGPLTPSDAPFNTIISQLVSIDTTIFRLISSVGAGGSYEPTASILSSILGSAANSCTSAIILWSLIRVIVQYLPTLWLTVYELGLCFYGGLPLRVGRSLGGLFMATSLVLAVGLPLTPFFALSLQGPTDFEIFLKEFEDIAKQVQADPSSIIDLISSIPETTGNLMASVYLSLVVFPTVYLLILSILARSLARLFGGSGRGLTITRFILSPVT